MISTYLFT